MSVTFSPSNQNIDKWVRHFNLLVKGDVRPDEKGFYVIENTQKGEEKKVDGEGSVEIVTQTAQNIEIAKSEISNSGRELTDSDQTQF